MQARFFFHIQNNPTRPPQITISLQGVRRSQRLLNNEHVCLSTHSTTTLEMIWLFTAYLAISPKNYWKRIIFLKSVNIYDIIKLICSNFIAYTKGTHMHKRLKNITRCKFQIFNFTRALACDHNEVIEQARIAHIWINLLFTFKPGCSALVYLAHIIVVHTLHYI